MDIALFGEIRGWLAFLFAALGGSLALRSYLAGQRQRRLENSFRMVQLFHDSLRPTDLERWEELFHASSEPAGASEGHFVVMEGADRMERPFSDLFTEGPYDEGAVERMAEVFDLIGYEFRRGTIDLRSIYFQLGQLMDTVYSWLNSVKLHRDRASLVERLYPHYHRLYVDGELDQKWPRKTYAHIG